MPFPLFRLCYWAFCVAGAMTVGVAQTSASLTTQVEKNLMVYARAFAQIAFCHPSTEAVKADWTRIAPRGVSAVMGVENTATLAKALQSFFAPYAPSARFLLTNETAACPQVPEDTTHIVRWKPVAYKSRAREFVEFKEHPPKGWDDPQSNTAFSLSEELRGLIPTVCFSDINKQTLPVAPAGMQNGTGDTQKHRLAAVVVAWSVLSKYHPTAKAQAAAWNTALAKGLQEVYSASNTAGFEAALRNMLATLNDKQLLLIQGSASPDEENAINAHPIPGGYKLCWPEVTPIP